MPTLSRTEARRWIGRNYYWGRVDSWSGYQHFSLDFLDFPCDTNTMNIVLNALTAFTSCNFSVRLQEAVGRSYATELAKPEAPRQLEATIG